ncbi:unnamed protein product, partial [Pelagomonas calceolata]
SGRCFYSYTLPDRAPLVAPSGRAPVRVEGKASRARRRKRIVVLRDGAPRRLARPAPRPPLPRRFAVVVNVDFGERRQRRQHDEGVGHPTSVFLGRRRRHPVVKGHRARRPPRRRPQDGRRRDRRRSRRRSRRRRHHVRRVGGRRRRCAGHCRHPLRGRGKYHLRRRAFLTRCAPLVRSSSFVAATVRSKTSSTEDIKCVRI